MKIILRSIRFCLRWARTHSDPGLDPERTVEQILDVALIEDLCRIICVAEDMNPDIESTGCGMLRPLGEKYLWEARRPVVEALLIRYRIVPRTGDLRGPETERP